MRWLFIDSRDRRETAQREQAIAAMQRWWNAFLEKQADLQALFAGHTQWDLAGWMQETLQAIAPQLMWEFGPGTREGAYRLVITPEADRHLRPLVNELLRRAPSLPQWEFHGHRLPEPLADVIETVRGACDGDISAARVEARRDRRHRIDLTYYCPHCREPDDEQAQFAAFVATEALLGEALLDRWIGNIRVEPVTGSDPERVARAWSLDRLQPTLQAIISSIIDQLPDQPSWAFVPGSNFRTYELRPEVSADYPARTDLCLAQAGRADVFEANHDGGVFYSENHSRWGELFCYLKIDGAGRSEQQRALQRETVAHALDERLVPQKTGCVIGGGTGLRYSYIDLALVDLPRALPAIQSVASDFFLPSRSWLQFCDDELAVEWVGLTPDAVPPLL
jgi:hypothetical protein